MLASLESIEDSDLVMVRYLDNWFKLFYDHIGDMADVVGTSNVNVHTDKHHKIKSLFRNRRRMIQRQDEDVKYIPGVGKVKIVSDGDDE